MAEDAQTGGVTAERLAREAFEEAGADPTGPAYESLLKDLDSWLKDEMPCKSETKVRKRGRPSKSSKGLQPDTRQGWMMFRDFVILEAYDASRSNGKGRTAAIYASVQAVKTRVPRMPCSETEVKRVLAKFRPGRGRVGLIRAGLNAENDLEGELVCHWDGDRLVFGVGQVKKQTRKAQQHNYFNLSNKYK